MPSPTLDYDPGLLERVENLTVEQLVSQSGVEVFDKTVLPGAARCDVGRLGTNRMDPLLDGLGDELGAIVGADVAGHAAQNELVGEHIDDIRAVEPAVDPDRQTFVGELVDEIEHAVFPPLMGAVLHEVVTPDVVGSLGAQSNARAAV